MVFGWGKKQQDDNYVEKIPQEKDVQLSDVNKIVSELNQLRKSQIISEIKHLRDHTEPHGRRDGQAHACRHFPDHFVRPRLCYGCRDPRKGRRRGRGPHACRRFAVSPSRKKIFVSPSVSVLPSMALEL